MAGHASKFVHNGEVDIHYIEAGPAEGPLVVLLHGFPCCSLMWQRQIGPLAEAGFRVVAPDMRGINLSSKPPSKEAYGAAPVLSDVTALLDHLAAGVPDDFQGGSSAGAQPKPTLVGHDWGGIVAWRYAQEHPERLARLIILNMAFPQDWVRALVSDPMQMQRSWYVFMFQLADVGENVMKADNFAFSRVMFKLGVAKPLSEADIEEYVGALSRPGALSAAINYYRNVFDNWGMQERKKVEVPVLLLWGDKEVSFEPYLSEPPKDFVPDLKIVHFPEATHFVMWDEAEKVTEEIKAFLQAA